MCGCGKVELSRCREILQSALKVRYPENEAEGSFVQAAEGSILMNALCSCCGGEGFDSEEDEKMVKRVVAFY